MNAEEDWIEVEMKSEADGDPFDIGESLVGGSGLFQPLQSNKHEVSALAYSSESSPERPVEMNRTDFFPSLHVSGWWQTSPAQLTRPPVTAHDFIALISY